MDPLPPLSQVDPEFLDHIPLPLKRELELAYKDKHPMKRSNSASTTTVRISCDSIGDTVL
jgi:hypothetical protein